MEKLQTKARSIRFFSLKNGAMITVNSRLARDYTEKMESCDNVLTYQASVPLEKEKYQYVNPLDIRKEYFDEDWASDFAVVFKDGSVGIREIIRKTDLARRAVIEKLEFSRRYWAVSRTCDWKVVIVEEEGYVY